MSTTHRRTLIVGGAGLVGSRLSRLMRSRGHEVTITTRRDDARAASARIDGIDVIVTDVGRPDDVAGLPDSFDTIVYLAQSPRFREVPAGATDMIAVNVASAVVLAQRAAASADRSTFVYASTGAVYGTGPQPFSETSPLAQPGTGFYAASKLSAEYAIRALAPHLRTIVLRPFFVYGTGMNETMLMNSLFRSVAAGRPISLNGHEDGLRFQPTAADDAALQIMALLDAGDDDMVANIVGDRVHTLREVAIEIGATLGVEPIFEQVPGDGQQMIADDSLIRSIAGPCTVSLAEGVRGMTPA